MLYEFDTQQLETIRLGDGQPSDELLMERIRARDEGALQSLMRRHSRLLRTIIGRVVHQDQDIDDVLQDVLLETWNRIEHFDSAKGKALGWIVTLARRRAIDRIRRKMSYNRAEERFRHETESTARSEGGRDNQTCDEAEATDLSHWMKQALIALPEAQQEVIHLAYYQGLSQREIAARTLIPLGTIKTRLELAVRKLKSAVLAAGGTQEFSFAHA